jgi:hypothetical protein
MSAPDQKSNRRRPKSLSPVDGILNQLVSTLGLDKRLKEKTLMDFWPEVVGQPLAEKTRCLFIDYEGQLVIAVKDASVGQELSLARTKLLRQMRQASQAVGLNLTGIRFDLKSFHNKVSDPWENASIFERELPLPKDEDLSAVNLSTQELEQIHDLKESILKQNQAFAERISALFERQLRLKSWQKSKGFPTCSLCSQPASRLHGDSSLCPTCYLEHRGEPSRQTINP